MAAVSVKRSIVAKLAWHVQFGEENTFCNVQSRELRQTRRRQANTSPNPRSICQKLANFLGIQFLFKFKTRKGILCSHPLHNVAVQNLLTQPHDRCGYTSHFTHRQMAVAHGEQRLVCDSRKFPGIRQKKTKIINTMVVSKGSSMG